jgi:2-succinyl-6-hydroxy-2,4-cyclohexadiene-1-carboxylate synthase
MSGLWLHGFTGSPAAFDAVISARPGLPSPCRPALAGHGLAPAPVSSFEDEVSRLAGIADETGEGAQQLVGYSLGARFALALALARPRRVRALTLVGASAGIDDPSERRARAEADDRLAELLEQHGLPAFVARWQAQPLFASQARLPAPRRRAREAERLAHLPLALAAALRAFSKGRMPSLWPLLPELAQPVTLVVGALDGKFLGEAERMAARLPRARVVVVPRAGHDVALEQPAALAAVLDEVGA